MFGFRFVGVDGDLGTVFLGFSGFIVMDLDDDVSSWFKEESGVGREEMSVGAGRPSAEGSIRIESHTATGGFVG